MELSLTANKKEETQNPLYNSSQGEKGVHFTISTHIRVSLASNKEMTKEPPPQTPLKAAQVS